MFPIIVNDGQTPFPDDDIYYIVCKEGVYLKKRLGVMESIAPVKQISILDSIQCMAKMHIKKIPATKAKQVINFFKEVYKEFYGEAIVLLFYNQETKQHKIVCPNQEVSGGGADYNKGIVIEGWDMIGTIHSHASMSAFHSGIDDKDEESFDGLHITFGNMRDDDISVSASIVANGYRVIVDPRDYINKMELTVNIDEEEEVPFARTWKWDPKLKKMAQVETAGKYFTRRKFDQRYKVVLSKDPKFDATWMDRVKKYTYKYKAPAGKTGTWDDGWYGHGARYGQGSYWKNWGGHQNTKGKPVTTVPAVLNADKKPVSEDNKLLQVLENLHDHEQKTIIKWALEQLDGDASDVIKESLGEESDDLIHYHCINCEGKFTIDESDPLVEACCPKCGIDDYLVEISATEMMMDDADPHPSDEEIEADSLGMIECKTCNSSFTKDFLVNGECPTCHTVLVPEEHPSSLSDEQSDSDNEDDGFVQCPSCFRHFARVSLRFDLKCKFCEYEFDISSLNMSQEEILEHQSASDSGAYLDPDRHAIEKAIGADAELERIPVPDQDSVPLNKKQRKPGVFASLFNKRNRK